MKNSFLRAFAISLAAFVMMAAFFVAPSSVRAADDINAMYQKGRAAFYKGDHELALSLLSQVAAAAPNHTDTQNMLRMLKANQKLDVSTLKKDYSAVVLPKIEMQDVTLDEAIQGLRVLSKNASAGKVSPNIIVKSSSLKEKRLSLSLANVPLPQAIDYLAQLTGGVARYEKYAVVISEVAQIETASQDAK